MSRRREGRREEERKLRRKKSKVGRAFGDKDIESRLSW
jgi:hypothetical protein